jgi:hypothetical protein
MSTMDTIGARVAGMTNDFAIWRLRAEEQYLRAEARSCVERLKAACADEARAHWKSTARTIAAFAP